MSKLGFSKSDNATRCKNSAIYSLAMREHSRHELKNKLLTKDFSENVDLEKILDALEKSDYQSDQRFTESFIRYRVSRGQGKVKIINELKLRGVNQFMIGRAIQQSNINWLELAVDIRVKKFGEIIPSDFKEKAKQMRFLAGRGFDTEMIKHAVS